MVNTSLSFKVITRYIGRVVLKVRIGEKGKNENCFFWTINFFGPLSKINPKLNPRFNVSIIGKWNLGVNKFASVCAKPGILWFYYYVVPSGLTCLNPYNPGLTPWAMCMSPLRGLKPVQGSTWFDIFEKMFNSSGKPKIAGLPPLPSLWYPRNNRDLTTSPAFSFRLNWCLLSTFSF